MQPLTAEDEATLRGIAERHGFYGPPISFGSGTHLMVPVGDPHVIYDGGTSWEGLRHPVRPVTRLPHRSRLFLPNAPKR